MNFMNFFGMYSIFTDFNSFKNGKKGVNFLQEPRVDVVQCGTRADATWHARPRGSATQTHASAC